MARGRLALSIIEARLKPWAPELQELRLELIGVDSICGGMSSTQPAQSALSEVRVRAAARASSLAAAQRVGREVEALYTNGPAGGGGASQSAKPVVAIASTFVRRQAVEPRLFWEVIS